LGSLYKAGRTPSKAAFRAALRGRPWDGDGWLEPFLPLVNFFLGLILGYPIALLNFADKLIASAFDDIDFVIGKLAPFFFCFSFKLFPLARDLIPIHDQFSFFFFGLHSRALGVARTRNAMCDFCSTYVEALIDRCMFAGAGAILPGNQKTVRNDCISVVRFAGALDSVFVHSRRFLLSKSSKASVH